MPGVRGRRYLVILAILVGLVGLYAAVGFLLVPRVTRSELVGLTAREFGRTLSIGDVSFNPFTWKMQITDLSLPDADGRPMVSFGRLDVTVAISSVSHLAPTLSDVVLESPRVNAVVRRDGRLNLADLAKPSAPPANAQAPASKPFKLVVDRFVVVNGGATYEDDSRPAPFRLDLDPLAFELLNFSTTGGQAGSYHLTATIGQGGRLDWSGTIRLQPLSLRGTLALDGLGARTVASYLGPILPAELSSGTLALQGGFALDSQPNGAAGQGVRMTIDLPRVQVSGLGVRPRQATSDYVQLNRFTLSNAHIDLEQHTVRVGQITLAGADVRGWLDQGGKLNLLELLGQSAPPQGAAQPAAPPASPSSASPAPAWRIAAPDIRVADTRVALEDRSIKPTAHLTLSAISAQITGYDSSPQSHITVSLRSAVNGNGQLRLTAQGGLQPRVLTAKLGLSQIDLRALQPYLNKYTALTLASGSFGTELDIERNANGALTSAGRIDITDLRAVDDDLKQDFVKWQGLHLVGFRYASNPASLHIEDIVAVAPYARVIIGADHTVNLSEALHPRGAHPQAAPAKGAQPATVAAAGKAPSASSKTSMAMTIGLVRVANGTADYADFSMEPNFATGIQDLHGTVKGLSSDPSSRATVDLEGRVDRYAPVDISGVVNLLAATTYSDISMKFRGLQLTRMTPYSVRFAGYKIASGTLDADLHYKLDHGTLNADHTLVVDQLQLGDQVASPHAVKLPLRLAVALLKDRDGVIRIGLPVTGSLNNPQFSLGPLIRKALFNLLMKAVTAPFALLGHAFGGGSDLDHIDFAPGSASLLPAAQTRVAALAKALTQRPQLKLQVPGAFALEVDGPALAQRQLRQQLIALARSGAGSRDARGGGGRGKPAASPTAGREVLELPGEHYRLLRTAYQNAFGPTAPLPATAQKVPPYEPAILEMQSALLKRIQVSDADLQALGDKRAQAIRAAIVAAGGVDAGRVAVTAAKSQPAAAGKVAVKLGLK
jgi:uncharacterized protein involved in outer membrane biogenesis